MSLLQYLKEQNPNYDYKIEYPRRKCIVITRKDVKVSPLDTMVSELIILGTVPAYP